MTFQEHQTDRDTIILDTTLRDGDQAGVLFSQPQKILIAHGLDEIGVDVIEAGNAFSGAFDRQSIAQISREVRRPVICSLAICNDKAIEAAASVLEGAERARIHLYRASSKEHLQNVFHGMGEQQYLDDIAGHIERARRYTSDVEYSAEDATNTPWEFLARIARRVAEAGGTTFNAPDTYGQALPTEMQGMMEYLYDHVPAIRERRLRVSTHNHDDQGLATANTLFALHGMRDAKKQAELTVNGLGERGGNSSLAETVMTSRYRKDRFSGFHFDHIRSEMLVRLSRVVSALSGVAIPRNTPFVGAGVNALGTGTHVAAQGRIGLGNGAYRDNIPRDVGFDGFTIEFGATSGKGVADLYAQRLGYRIPEADLVPFTAFAKAYAEQKRGTDCRTVTPEEYRSLLAQYFGIGVPVKNGEKQQFLHAVKNGQWLMGLTVDCRNGQEQWEARSEERQGALQGVAALLREKSGIDFAFEDQWEQSDRSRGEKSGSVTVITITVDKQEYQGVAEGTDVTETTVRALFDAVNKAQLARIALPI
ncbi:MAG: hypothetical protein PHW10_03965 [Candidatus Peribacteraceae bacterium]|nr:hypothetical protein [Candidatus Peribacteraceae bacterium]